TVVAGIRSNAGLLASLARADAFRAARFDTGFVERHLDALGAATPGPDRAAAAAGALHLLNRDAARNAADGKIEWPSPWDAHDGFQLSGRRETTLPLEVDRAAATATVRYRAGAALVTVDGALPASDVSLIDGGDAVYVVRRGRQTVVRLRALDPFDAAHAGEGGRVTAPMHGKVIEVLV